MVWGEGVVMLCENLCPYQCTTCVHVLARVHLLSESELANHHSSLIRRVHPQSDSHHKLSCKCSSLYCCMLFGELRLWFILSRKLGTENWIWQDFSLKGFIDRACHTPHQRSKEIRGNACWVLLLYTVSATCYSLFMTSCMPIAVISCHCLIFLFV